jgi:ribosomal protein S12 methylthiotransferase accessory factor
LYAKESALMNAEQRTYEYWLGSKELKYSPSGVERGVRPSVTIRRARAMLDVIGVTKVADVTDLDRVGIPNFMAVRPHDLGPGISYYSGKGRTRSDAHAGALMEAIERHAGESYDGPITQSSYHNLRQQHACVDPLEIHVPMVGNYNDRLLVEWVSGFDLLNRRSTFVPLNCVVAPYEPPFSCMPLFFSSTNGLASGNTRLEALCHALCEVIERDSMALALARSQVKPAVGAILSEMGFNGRVLRESVETPRVSLRGLPRSAAAVVHKLQRAGLEVRLRILTSNSGIPTIGCTIVDRQAPPTVMNEHGGCGTHPDARVALLRALTEAAQTRVTFIQGGREDLPEIAGDRDVRPADKQAVDGPMIVFTEIESREHSLINEDVEFMLERMRGSGFAQVVVVDLTKADIGIPVVRVIVPRAESWTMYFLHTGRAGLGRRVLQQIDEGKGEHSLRQ